MSNTGTANVSKLYISFHILSAGVFVTAFSMANWTYCSYVSRTAKRLTYAAFIGNVDPRAVLRAAAVDDRKSSHERPASIAQYPRD